MKKQGRKVSVVFTLVLIAGVLGLFIGCNQPSKGVDSAEELLDFETLTGKLQAEAVKADGEMQAAMANFEAKLAAYSGSDKIAIQTAYNEFKTACTSTSILPEDIQDITDKKGYFGDKLEACTDDELKAAGEETANLGFRAALLGASSRAVEDFKPALEDLRNVVEEHGDDAIKTAWAKEEEADLKLIRVYINCILTNNEPSEDEIDAMVAQIESAKNQFAQALDANPAAAAVILPKLTAYNDKWFIGG